ncbi:MAG: enoyl-CoA hydratase [Rhodospirillaceae bacterium]
MTEEVRRKDRGGVTWLTVAREAKLNVLNSPMIAALNGHLKDLSGQAGLRAVVLTGAGDRAFVGGADIGEMAALDEASASDFITRLHGVMTAVRDLPVPVIARIDGYCLGGGMELAAACDIRISSDRAKFGMPEARVGLPSVIEATLLPGLIGWGRCRWLLMTGEVIDAPTAHAWGFVEFMTAPGDLDGTLDETLAAITAAGPHAVATQKKIMRSWEAMAPDDAAEATIPVFAGSFRTGEPQAMLGAFVKSKQKK